MKSSSVTNTAQYIPFECVAPILLENAAHPEFPFFSGTGFFLYFPPYEDIFFITAKHCTIDSNGKELGELKIKYHPDQTSNDAVQFDEYILTGDLEEEGELEDLIIYVVGSVTEENKKILKNRALRLQHQDDVALIINTLVKNKDRVRTVGFPSVSKEINYDEATAVVRPRGFHGKLEGDSGMKNRYKVGDLNWNEDELGGFSGAPILALCPTMAGEVLKVPIGMLLTGATNCAHFLSINVATDSIAKYLTKKYQLVPETVEGNA